MEKDTSTVITDLSLDVEGTLNDFTPTNIARPVKRCRYAKCNNSEATGAKVLQSACPIHYHEIRLKNNEHR